MKLTLLMAALALTVASSVLAADPVPREAPATMLQGAASASSATQAEKRMAVSVLRPDQHILIVTKSTPPSFEGQFVTSRGDSILLRLDQGIVSVPLNYVDELWVRGRSVKGGAFIGAIAGLSSASFVSIFALATNSDSFTTSNDYLVAVAAYTIVGAGIGALAGSRLRWQQRYP